MFFVVVIHHHHRWVAVVVVVGARVTHKRTSPPKKKKKKMFRFEDAEKWQVNAVVVCCWCGRRRLIIKWPPLKLTSDDTGRHQHESKHKTRRKSSLVHKKIKKKKPTGLVFLRQSPKIQKITKISDTNTWKTIKTFEKKKNSKEDKKKEMVFVFC